MGSQPHQHFATHTGPSRSPHNATDHSLSGIGPATPMIPKKAQKCGNTGSPYLDRCVSGKGGGGYKWRVHSWDRGTKWPSWTPSPSRCCTANALGLRTRVRKRRGHQDAADGGGHPPKRLKKPWFWMQMHCAPRNSFSPTRWTRRSGSAWHPPPSGPRCPPPPPLSLRWGYPTSTDRDASWAQHPRPPPVPPRHPRSKYVCTAVYSEAQEGVQSKSQREKLFSDVSQAPFAVADESGAGDQQRPLPWAL